MRIKHGVGSLFALSLILVYGPVVARAQTATLSIDSLQVTIPVNLIGGNYQTNNGLPFTLTSLNNLESITFSATGKPDPFLSYSFSVTNNDTSTHTYGFSFVTPITTAPAGTVVRDTLSGSLTAGDADGVTIAPITFAGITRGSVNGMGIPALDLGSAQTSTTGTNPYPPSGIFSTSYTSPVAITSLDVTGSFSLTGGGDSAAITGLLTTVVPEPSSLVLCSCSMLVGLMILAFKRNRAAIPA